MSDIKSNVSPFNQGNPSINVTKQVLVRNGSQIHQKRSEFESERKVHRRNLYDAIVRNERSAETNVSKHGRYNTEGENKLKPRWNKNFVKVDIKRKLFEEGNHSSNHSMSIPSDEENNFASR